MTVSVFSPSGDARNTETDKEMEVEMDLNNAYNTVTR